MKTSISLSRTLFRIPASTVNLLAPLAILALLALFDACSTDSGSDPEFVSVTLAATRLKGSYTLVDYLFEYGDGQKYDSSLIKVTGTLSISADSAYVEGIRVESDSTTTKGHILKVLAMGGNVEKGQLELDLDQGGAAAVGKSDYAFKHDTLVLVTEVSKERDASKKGFKETAYYRRD